MHKQRRVATLVVGLTAVISLVGGPSPAAALSIALPPDGEGSVARNVDGRLEAFGVDLDGRVVTNFQYAIGSGWSGFYPFANDFGARTTEPVTSHPLEDGRLMIAWLGNDGFPYFAMQRNDGPGWTAIGRLGETQFNSPPTLVSPPVLARNPDGRLSAFGITADGRLLHAWQTSITGGFTAWGVMSNLVFSADPEGAIAVIDDRIDPLMRVYAVTAAGELVRFVQEQGGFWWSEPRILPGSPVGKPAAGRRSFSWDGDGAGVEAVFFRRTDGLLGMTDYHPMIPTTTSLTTEPVVGPPSVGTNRDGRLEVFVTGANGSMLHAYDQGSPPDAVPYELSPPYPMGGPCAGPPNVATNDDGRLELFCVATSGALIHTFQVAPNAHWSGFFSLGGTLLA